MKIMQAFKMAIRSIFSNKVRSFLTMLGVIIGVSSVIIAVGFAQGSTSSITSSLSSLGTNLINISITGRGSNRTVTYDELKQFQQENSSVIASVAPQVSATGTVKYLTENHSTTILGTSPDYADINSVTVQSGRFISEIDMNYREKVAVVGPAVINDVFGGADPIGKTIKIMGQQFTVVGELTEVAGAEDSTNDDRVIIPVTVATRLSGNATIRSFSVKATKASTVNAAVDDLDTFLTSIFPSTGSNSTSNSSFRVTNMSQVLSTLNSVTGTMTMVLAGIAAISLIVGGIGIMNIMLVSVKERTREIGIRKAIGAKKGSILVQFLIESVVVTGLGGVIGILIGIGVIKFVIGGLHLVTPVYSIPWIIASFGVSLGVGLFFGMYPANKAANLNPIDALMYE